MLFAILETFILLYILLLLCTYMLRPYIVFYLVDFKSPNQCSFAVDKVMIKVTTTTVRWLFGNRWSESSYEERDPG